jgi:hypothetical protein
MFVSTFSQTHSDRSDNVCLNLQNWCYSILFQHFTNIYRITSVLKVETDIITPITVSLTEGWDKHYHSYHSESDWRLRQTLSLQSQWVWLKVETDIITPITVSLTEGWDRHYHSYHSESDWRLRPSVRLTVIGVIMSVSTFRTDVILYILVKCWNNFFSEKNPLFEPKLHINDHWTIKR